MDSSDVVRDELLDLVYAIPERYRENINARFIGPIDAPSRFFALSKLGHQLISTEPIGLINMAARAWRIPVSAAAKILLGKYGDSAFTDYELAEINHLIARNDKTRYGWSCSRTTPKSIDIHKPRLNVRGSRNRWNACRSARAQYRDHCGKMRRRVGR